MIKIGLALGGGGAKGSYQMGIIKALEEHRLLDKIEVLSGTSIGAINALLLMSGKNHDEMMDIWSEMNNEGVYGSGIKILDSKYEKMYDITPLFEKLSQYITTRNIRDSKYECYVTAAKIIDESIILSQFRPHHMEKTKFCLNDFILPRKAVLASASIPGLFGPTEILGEKYVDGGILDNHSMEPLIDVNCNVIFNAPVDQFFKVDQYENDKMLLIDFTSKYAFHKTYVLDLIDAMRFEEERIEERYLYGYLVAKKVLEKLFSLDLIDDNLNFKSIDEFIHIKLEDEEDLEIDKYIKDKFK